ncbi:MAG: C25 family cysteine peptidase, partial [Phycisphaerae bacterium]
MLNSLTGSRWWSPALALALLTSGGAVADSWVTIAADGTPGITEPEAQAREKETTQAEAPQLDVLGHDENGIQVTVDVPGVSLLPRKTKRGEFVVVSWPEAAPAGDIGAPALPVIRRLFIAPPGASVSVTPTLTATAVIDRTTVGFPLQVMPRQAPIPKTPGAWENAPFDFDPAAYAIETDYLAEPATVEELGIARGQRLFLLEVHPVAYNPVAQTIRFRSQMDLTIEFSSGSSAPDITPLPGLDRIVLNPDRDAASRRGSGTYLIIVPTTYESDIMSFADAKAAQGFTVMTHVVAPGTSNTVIKSYIQSLWGGQDAPEYILLVGDTNTIPHWVGQGSGSPSTDLPYACMDGSGDWYPDIAIGRFPTRSSAQVSILVDKTLYYENGPLADPGYKKRAAFMASVDNYYISEGTHNYVIDTWLAPNDYQCDRLYQVTYGATTQDVRDAFNDGRFYGVYSGHGDTTYWADGPPFYPSDVNNLTNENMYAFICSFACLTGDFVYPECFMETWVLAPDKAALCSWGSSVTSYWDEDDILERRLFDAIFDDEDDVETEAGHIYNETKMRYLAHYGPTGTTRRYFEMYNLMGDPSLPLPSACSHAGTITLDRAKYACESTALITVSDCGLNLDDNLIDTVEITLASDSEPGGETVVLYETDTATAEFEGAIELSTTDAVGVLLVAEGDTVTATYIDADDGQGGTDVEVTTSALVDCTPPNIWNVQTINIEPRSATVTFDADELVRGTVHYGLSCDNLSWLASGGYGNPASVNLSGLQDNTTYFYIVVAEDEAGN